MREPITLKELLAVVIKAGWGILCAAVALAVVLGGWQFSKQLAVYRMPENTPQRIEEDYQAAMGAYMQELEALELACAERQILLDNWQQYAENSLLMRMEPDKVVKKVVVYAISDLELRDEERNFDGDSYSHAMNQLQVIYNAYWSAVELHRQLQGTALEGMGENFIREAILFSVEEAGTVTITARADSQEVAELLMKAAGNCLQEVKTAIAEKVRGHSIMEVSSILKIEADDGVLSYQEYQNEQINILGAELTALEEQIKALGVPQRRASYSKRAMLTATAKWVILGGILGAVLGCAWVLAMYLFQSKVESSRQMEQLLALPFLGSAAPRGSIWKRLADRMVAERVWNDPAQAQAYMTESFRNADAAEGLLIITTLREKKLTKELQFVAQAAAAAGIKAVCVAEAEENAQTVVELQNCKRVVLAERIGVSEVPRMQGLLKLAERMQAEVVGFVTV